MAIAGRPKQAHAALPPPRPIGPPDSSELSFIEGAPDGTRARRPGGAAMGERRRGRPPIPADEPLQLVTTRLPVTVMSRVRVLAAERGEPIAKVLADLLREGLGGAAATASDSG